jgi:plasmid stability protein
VTRDGARSSREAEGGLDEIREPRIWRRLSSRPAYLASYHPGVGLTRQQPHFQPPFRCQPELDRLRKAAKDRQATQAECRDWLLEATPLEEGRTRLNLAPRGGVKLSGAEPLAKYFFSGSIERISSEQDQVTFEGTV